MSSNVFNTLCLFRSLRLYNSLYSTKKLDLYINKRLIFGINKSTSDGKHSQPEQQQQRQNVETEVNEALNNEKIDANQLLAENKKLREENEKLIELTKDIDDKYKRSLADGENMRIRTKKQVDDAKLYGNQNICKDLLDIADNNHIAVNSFPEHAITDDKQRSIMKNWFSGVQMNGQQLQTVFRKHGITQINPIGQKFNPNEHHAMFEIEDNSKEPGSVAIVTKIGYKLHDRTIRPAMVGVVKASNNTNNTSENQS